MQRIALVTGATRGIGKAIAIALKQEGHLVVGSYHHDDETAQNFKQETGMMIFKWDVGDYQSCLAGMDQVRAYCGHPDILINNAGITHDSMLHKMSIEHWQQVITTNLTSCFNMTKCVIEAMREQSFGRIISLSSVNALKGQVGQTNYCAAKAGIIGFTKALAQECSRKGITVNAIAPGYTDTEMVRSVPSPILESIIQQIPAGRLGTVEEIAKAAAFLASDQAGFITGATLNINGGQYMS